MNGEISTYQDLTELGIGDKIFTVRDSDYNGLDEVYNGIVDGYKVFKKKRYVYLSILPRAAEAELLGSVFCSDKDFHIFFDYKSAEEFRLCRLASKSREKIAEITMLLEEANKELDRYKSEMDNVS